MLKTRLIPVLLLRNGMLVRAARFEEFKVIGNPIHEVARYNEWQVDELIYLDITVGDNYMAQRHDIKSASWNSSLDILESVSDNCFMPLIWGGGIRDLEGMRARFARGADKITINSAAVDDPELIRQGARQFGSQAIVVSIDYRYDGDGRPVVFTRHGTTATGLDPVEHARRVEELGAGEILLQPIERDGMACGYDLEMIAKVSSRVGIPVIANSGAASYQDFVSAVNAGAAAVAAANLFHFRELSDRAGKKVMKMAGIDVR